MPNESVQDWIERAIERNWRIDSYPTIDDKAQLLEKNGLKLFQAFEDKYGFQEVVLLGKKSDAFRAVEICNRKYLPIWSLRKVWNFLGNEEPNSPCWELTFLHPSFNL